MAATATRLVVSCSAATCPLPQRRTFLNPYQMSNRSSPAPPRAAPSAREPTPASQSSAPAQSPDASSPSLLEVAIEAAQAGAAVIRAQADLPREVEFKGTTDLVTQVDKAAEKVRGPP